MSCRRWQGIPQSREGQALKWVRAKALRDYPMPPADLPLIAPLIDLLRLDSTPSALDPATPDCLRARVINCSSRQLDCRVKPGDDRRGRPRPFDVAKPPRRSRPLARRQVVGEGDERRVAGGRQASSCRARSARTSQDIAAQDLGGIRRDRLQMARRGRAGLGERSATASAPAGDRRVICGNRIEPPRIGRRGGGGIPRRCASAAARRAAAATAPARR